MRKISLYDIIYVWEIFPWDFFVPSLKIDFISFLSGTKDVVRSKLSSGNVPFLGFLNDFNIKIFIDKEGYIFIAISQEHLKQALYLDISLDSHEVEFGRLLGYPDCCVNNIKTIGENNIDEYGKSFSKELVEKLGDINLNIECYEKGFALISHVPCSIDCPESLNIAYANIHLIKEIYNIKKQDSWLRKMINFESLFKKQIDYKDHSPTKFLSQLFVNGCQRQQFYKK